MNEHITTSNKQRQTRHVPILAMMAMLVSSGCSVFGVESVEEAPYQLVQKEKRFEVREYQSLVVVETLVTADYKDAGNTAFRKLFAYISGKNEADTKIAMTAPVLSEADNTGQKIAMTAPVLSEKDGEAWRYSFVLPATFTMDNAPRPLDPDVSLVQIPERRMAVLRYAGRISGATQSEKAEVLSRWIEEQGLEARSAPRWAGYNAPWTLPPLRRNEVLIEVSER